MILTIRLPSDVDESQFDLHSVLLARSHTTSFSSISCSKCAGKTLPWAIYIAAMKELLIGAPVVTTSLVVFQPPWLKSASLRITRIFAY